MLFKITFAIVFCAGMFFVTHAQLVTDTTYGFGKVNVITPSDTSLNDSLNITVKPIMVLDSIPDTTYTYYTQLNDSFYYHVITSLNWHIGIQETPLLNDVEVYPLPGSDFNVVLPSTGNYQIQVINLQGQKLKEEKYFNTQHLYISLQDLADAIYVLNISNSAGDINYGKKVLKTSKPLVGRFERRANETEKKIAQTATAVYQFTGKLSHHYPLDEQRTISDSLNGDIDLVFEKWKQDRGQGVINTRNITTNQKVGNIPFTLISDSIAQTNTPYTISDTTTIGGGEFYDVIVYEDTIAKVLPASSVAKYTVITPKVNTTSAADSINPNLTRIGYEASSSNVSIPNGWNPSQIDIYLTPTPAPSWIGHQKVVGNIYDVDGNTISGVTVYGKDLTTNDIDTAISDANGHYVFPSSSQPDGFQSGNTIKWAVFDDSTSASQYFAYVGDIYNVPDVTLANADTVRNINWTLIPRTLEVPNETTTVTATAGEIIDAHDKFNLQFSIHDTINYCFSDTASYGASWPTKKIQMHNNLDSITKWFGINFKEYKQAFDLQTAVQTYNPYASNQSDIGTNIFNSNAASNSTWINVTGLPNINNLQYTAIIAADSVIVSGGNPAFTKEMAGRLMGAGPVTLRTPSYMNGIPSLPNLEDRGIRYAIQKVGINKYRPIKYGQGSMMMYNLNHLKDQFSLSLF